MNKDIYHFNTKNQLHGYQELYWKGKLIIKCFYNNGEPIDYDEFYYFSGKLYKYFHI